MIYLDDVVIDDNYDDNYDNGDNALSPMFFPSLPSSSDSSEGKGGVWFLQKRTKDCDFLKDEHIFVKFFGSIFSSEFEQLLLDFLLQQCTRGVGDLSEMKVKGATIEELNQEAQPLPWGIKPLRN